MQIGAAALSGASVGRTHRMKPVVDIIGLGIMGETGSCVVGHDIDANPRPDSSSVRASAMYDSRPNLRAA